MSDFTNYTINIWENLDSRFPSSRKKIQFRLLGIPDGVAPALLGKESISRFSPPLSSVEELKNHTPLKPVLLSDFSLSARRRPACTNIPGSKSGSAGHGVSILAEGQLTSWEEVRQL